MLGLKRSGCAQNVRGSAFTARKIPNYFSNRKGRDVREQGGESMKLKTSRKLMLIAAVSLLSGSMVVYAATTLFTQTFPGQTFTVVTLTAGSCGSSLVLNSGSVVPTYAGGAAYLEYDCGGGVGGEAFSSTGTTSTMATATPTFTLPSGWSLSVAGYGSGCTSGTTPLASGTPISLTGGTTYEYCLTSSSASTFTSFSIAWSQ